MTQANFTTIKEMTAKVNELLEMLEKAKTLTTELVTANARNYYQLQFAPNSPEVKAEDDRPLSLKARIAEARKYEAAFENLRGQLTRAEMYIARNY